jgi:hypothetical protein
MPTATNLSSTRRTLRALRRRGGLTDANVALATLSLSTARALDEVLAGGDHRGVVDRLARAHLAVLQALEASTPEASSDPFSELIAELSTPSAGEGERWSGR